MSDQSPRVALYCRQSQTADGDTSASLTVQQRELEQLAQRRGWTIAGIYIDADAPAGDLDRRGRWLDLLNDLASFDLVAAYDTSRLWRSVELKVSTCRQLAAGGIARIATLGGEQPTDPRDDPEGGFVSTILAAAAEYDNQIRAAKSRRGRRHAAENGRPHIGGKRAYGYEIVGQGRDARRVVVGDEAAVIREVARRLLRGESLHAVADDLNRRGVTTSVGGPWRTSTLRSMALRPDLAGLRVWKGEIVTDQGEWPAILTRTQHDRLTARFSGAQRAPARRSLLGAGIAVCGACGHPLIATQGGNNRRGGTHRVYRCKPDTYPDACGRVSVMAAAVEREVAGRVCAALEGPELVAAVRTASADDDDARHASEQLAHLAERRRQIGEALAAGDLDIVTARSATSKLDTLERDARARLTATSRRDVDLLAEVAVNPHAWWDAADTPRRRVLVQMLVERVTVLRLERSLGNRFNPDRVQVTWRH